MQWNFEKSGFTYDDQSFMFEIDNDTSSIKIFKT